MEWNGAAAGEWQWKGEENAENRREKKKEERTEQYVAHSAPLDIAHFSRTNFIQILCAYNQYVPNFMDDDERAVCSRPSSHITYSAKTRYVFTNSNDARIALTTLALAAVGSCSRINGSSSSRFQEQKYLSLAAISYILTTVLY